MAVSGRNPTSGQRVKWSASFVRDLRSMVQWWKTNRGSLSRGLGADVYGSDAGSFRAIYYGASSASVAAYTPVRLFSSNNLKPDVNPEWYSNTNLSVIGPGCLEQYVNDVAITQTSAEHTDLIPVRTSGSTLARLKLLKNDHPAARIDDDEQGKTLVSDWSGQFVIKFADRSNIGSFQNALVNFEFYNPIYLATAVSDITWGTAGDVEIWAGNPRYNTGDSVLAWLDWIHGEEDISAGKALYIVFCPIHARWYILGAACEDPESIQQRARNLLLRARSRS